MSALFDVFDQVEPGQHVFIHSGASTPQLLVKTLTEVFIQKYKNKKVQPLHIYHIHTEGYCEYARPEYEHLFEVHSFFNGANIRAARKNINPYYIPIFLSEVPALFYNKHIQLDWALLQVSPPDQHGVCSLGPSVDISIAAARTAKKLVAQVNPQMPRVFGDGQLHADQLYFQIPVDEPVYSVSHKALSPVEQAIGQHVASLIEDGSTLQLGIGSIPNATLQNLFHLKNLGVHSEMFSDGVIELYKKGVINGTQKKKHPRKIVSSFVIGSQNVYNFIHDNPDVLLLDAAYTNSAHIIAQNPKVIAINSAIEVDLTGQICADSIGSKVFSGVGGQMDFIRGAALSLGGKPIIALPSITKNKQSKIVPQLQAGAGVVTTRAHAHYVVTEYGIAYLHGKTLRERAKALIAIADPANQRALVQAAEKMGL
ncbi:MAG: acetyl-CoA hydrolase/transferase family protein [Pseudobdellovibrionaceae bacterium]